MKDLISIIIPCYNAQHYLKISLDSVREQSYKNLEIIIVDDGSQDNTLKIATEFARIDNRITVIHQENLGVSVARNTGLKASNSDFVMFLDADDNYTTPLAIEKMINKMLESDADMCVCDFTHPCFEKLTKGDRVFDMAKDKDFLEFYQDFFLFGVPWNKITRKKCLTEKFVAGIKFNEDELFNLDNLHNINKIVFIDEVLHNYYCAPYNPNLPASAVNSIYSQEYFWEKKSTIWHLGMQNHKYRLSSISKFFPNKKEELEYVRSFDFFFWDFLLMAKNNVDEENIFKACLSIFETNLFKETLKSKKRYGLKLLPNYENNLKEFVKIAYFAFNDIKNHNKKLSMDRVLLASFAFFFYDIDILNTVDILAKSAHQFQNLLTAESYYVKFLLEKFKYKS